MSNAIAGDIFARIITDVVEQSKTDFEENGVSRQILHELQMTWQANLSARRVAQMPWDPKPTVESEANAAASKQAAAAQIKDEEVDPANGITYNPPEMASARAAALLQQTFGNQANASADALRQRGIALPGGQTMAAPSAPAPAPAPAANNGAHPQAQVKQENLSLSQTDGGGDVPETWDEVMAARRCADPESVAEHDATLRLAGNFDMNNGLMLPLGQSKRDGKKPKPIGPSESNIGQHDGAADNDDEDAINSDLDDPDDDAEGGDADDDEIQSMLCTYDKVHRTKNRWKCYLKDGILLANGKEYLFHKAQGDFEW